MTDGSAAENLRAVPTSEAASTESGPGGASASDARSLQRAASGDDAAFQSLVAKFDTRVRYVIFRVARGLCTRDPQWIDSVASRVWSGLLDWQRTSAGKAPDSVGALVARIARNQAITALRSDGRAAERIVAGGRDGIEAVPDVDESVDPAAAAERLDDLVALRGCLAALPDEDRELAEALDLIVNRRWREAGEQLGLSESTLRSRWNRVLERLRACLGAKRGKNFARGGGSGD